MIFDNGMDIGIERNELGQLVPLNVRIGELRGFRKQLNGDLSEKDRYFLLSALLSVNELIRQSAQEAIGNLGVKNRWILGQMIYQFDDQAHQNLSRLYGPFSIGLRFEDFALCEMRRYQDGEAIFMQGDKEMIRRNGREVPNSSAFAVFEGAVEIRRNYCSPASEGVLIHTYQRGGVFGTWTNLPDPALSGMPRTASAIAIPHGELEHALIAVMPRAEFLENFYKLPKKRQQEEIEFAKQKIAEGDLLLERVGEIAVIH